MCDRPLIDHEKCLVKRDVRSPLELECGLAGRLDDGAGRGVAVVEGTRRADRTGLEREYAVLRDDLVDGVEQDRVLRTVGHAFGDDLFGRPLRSGKIESARRRRCQRATHDDQRHTGSTRIEPLHGGVDGPSCASSRVVPARAGSRAAGL